MAGHETAPGTILVRDENSATGWSEPETQPPIERPALAPVVARRPRGARARRTRGTRAGPSDEDGPTSPIPVAARDPESVGLTEADRRMIDFLIDEAINTWR